MLRMFVCLGDATQLHANALLTLIDPDGFSKGAVEGAIIKAAGTQYHRQAQLEMVRNDGLKGGDSIITKGDRLTHSGSFDHVVFIIDDEEKPLSELVLAGLRAAKEQGFKYVSLPVLRSGQAFGRVEKTMAAVIKEMRLGIETFQAESAESDMIVTIVVYKDKRTLNSFSKFMLPIKMPAESRFVTRRK